MSVNGSEQKKTLILQEVSLRGAYQQRLHPISLTLFPQIYHLIGPNGAGKSTLLQLISGQLPCQGSIHYHKQAWLDLSSHHRALSCAVLLQHYHYSFALTVHELLQQSFILLGLPYQETAVILELLTQFNLVPLLHRQITTLSGGELQRVHIVRVLIQAHPEINPNNKLLLLDEPFTGLEPYYRGALKEYLMIAAFKEQIILLVHHELNMVIQSTDQIIVMHQGQVWKTGSCAEVLDKNCLTSIFNIPVHRLTLTSQQQWIIKE